MAQAVEKEILTDKPQLEARDLFKQAVKGLKDYRYFVTEILGHQYLDFHQQAMQMRLQARQQCEFEGKRFTITLWLAPRGHGKTTIGTTDKVTQDVVKQPDDRILICSNTAKQAEDMGAEVRQNLESRAITDRYGIQKPEKGAISTRWTNAAFSVHDRRRIGKEDTVCCMGWSGPIISKHNEKIYLDDVVDEEVGSSEGQREKQVTWFFKELLPCLEPGGEIHIVGTRYHPLDLYQAIMEKMENIVVRIDRAIDEEGNALWPERFSYDSLMQKKRESGAIIFNMQYQNDVELAKGQIFKPEYFQRYKEIPGTLEDIVLVCEFVDPQVGESERSDFFVNCACAVTWSGEIYFLPDCLRSRPDFEDKAQLCVGLHQQRQRIFDKSPLRLEIETVAAQSYLLERVQRIARDKGLELSSSGYTPHKDKVARAWRVTPVFEAKRVYFPANYPPMEEIIEEMMLFPDAEHDDGVDAIVGCVRMASAYYKKYKAAKESKKPPKPIVTSGLDREFTERLMRKHMGAEAYDGSEEDEE